MIPEYELISQIQHIQNCFANAMPEQFNQSALSILKEEEKKGVEEAVNIVLNQEEFSQQEATEALQLIASFTKLAVNFEFFHNLTDLWLKGKEIEAGVNKQGEIVLWVKKEPYNVFPCFFHRSKLA